jgi:hypothetical protein
LGVWPAPNLSSLAKERLKRLLPVAAFLVFVALETQATPKSDLWDRWTAHQPGSTLVPDHQAWSDFLGRYLVTSALDGINRVDYAGVTAEDRDRLKQYLLRLQEIPVSRLSRVQQLPYWINLYNAFTVHLVLEHYPLDSIVDIRFGFFDFGPWDEKLLRIEGEEVSLNDIEHRILRPIWKDPRLHYALNCASLGCPNLQPKAFNSENVESLLSSGARGYINDSRGMRFEDEDKLVLSKIYDWYGVDFGDDEKKLLQHLMRYANRSTKTRLKSFDGDIDFEYDWDLNSFPRKGS